jgi:eukaryotic-like serine/threonine-protein kinase
MTSSPTTSTVSFLTYENTTYGIKMQYPSDWLKGAGTSSTNNRYEVVAAFFSPLESSSDGYQECVQIVIDNSNGLNVNLAEYMIEKIDLIRESYIDFDLLASDTINVWLAGNPAYILLYKYSDPISGILEVMETGTIIRGKGYYIQYFAESAKYSNYLPTIQTMIDSFTLIAHE